MSPTSTPSTEILDGLPYNLMISLLIRGIHMGEISKVGWMIRLVRQVMWSDSLYSYTCYWIQFEWT